MDLTRAARLNDLIISSTPGCLIRHVIAFKRLQQTAEMLLPGCPPPPLNDIYDLATRDKDTGLTEPIDLFGPLVKPVMDICHSAVLKYTADKPARIAAVKIVAAARNPVIDAGGIHSSGKLIAIANDPKALLDASVIQREAFNWEPTPTQNVSAKQKTTNRYFHLNTRIIRPTGTNIRKHHRCYDTQHRRNHRGTLQHPWHHPQ